MRFALTWFLMTMLFVAAIFGSIYFPKFFAMIGVLALMYPANWLVRHFTGYDVMNFKDTKKAAP